MDAAVPARWRKPLFAVLAMSFTGLLAVPHLDRIRHASLYSDDLLRVADLQAKPLSLVLFRPFNEHMAPWFEFVSWVSWQAAGRDLNHTPIAFTLASYVPFLLALGLLAVWIRRETGSQTSAGVGCALFALSSLASECAFWFSASSFTWAVAWTLLALVNTVPREGGRPWTGDLALFLGAFLAPASSAIGLLAGPLAGFRLACVKNGRIGAFVPLAGTLSFLMVAASFRYDRVLGAGIRHPEDHLGGLILALEAPMARLVPGMLAAFDLDRVLPGGWILALSLTFLTIAGFRAIRGRHADLIGVALGLIVGGYGIIYPFRNIHGARWLFSVERFHLFPLVGLILLVCLVSKRWLSRYDRSPLMSLAVVNGVAALLLLIHCGKFERQATIYHHPEQAQTIAALVRVGDLCEELGVTQSQCLSLLDPVWSYWFQREFNGLSLVPKFGTAAKQPDEAVRELLLSRLTPEERQSLWGGMDISGLARPLGEIEGPIPRPLSVGHLVFGNHVKSLPEARSLPTFAMTGWPAVLEYQMEEGPDPAVPKYLCLATGPLHKPVEILWRSAGEGWSRSRSLRFQPDPGGQTQDWAIPLERVPHWTGAGIEGIRVRFVAPPIAFGEPRLVR